MISLLGKILCILNSPNLRPMMTWNSRLTQQFSYNGSYKSKIRRNIRQILDALSGNDTLSMLKSNDLALRESLHKVLLKKGILSKSEIRKLARDLKEFQALSNLSNCYKNTNLKKRWYFARELKKSGLSLKMARQYGYPISKRLWPNCNNDVERNKGGGISISASLRESIQAYLEEHSNISSNRLIVNKDYYSEDYREEVNVRYLEQNPTELYKAFPLRNKISKATFFKYLNKSGIYKKPMRMTDLCDYCEKGKTIKRSLPQRLNKLGYVWKDVFDTGHIIDFLNIKRTNLENEIKKTRDSNKHNAIKDSLELADSILNDIEAYETVTFHQNIARAQRSAYKLHHTQFEQLIGKIMIEVDFKQKIQIGFGPRQLNSEYYDKRNRLRTCLGFGIYYVDRINNNKINAINFDIIASDDCQDARAVVRGFRLLREQMFFKEIDNRSHIKEYIIWMDCGKHFRNREVVGYFFRELLQENIHVNLNFFVEKHGKNNRDAHFSMVSKFVKQESLKKRLISSKDVVNAIKNGQKLANENRCLNGVRRKNEKRNEPVRVEAIELNYTTMVKYVKNYPSVKPLTITNIESYYNYRISLDEEDGTIKLQSSILSNQNHLIDFTMNASEDNEITYDYEISKEDILYPEEMDSHIKVLQRRKDRINLILNKMKKDLISKGKQYQLPIFDFFSLNQRTNVANLTTAELPRSLPPYCRGEQIGNKAPCSTCEESCTLSIERLLKYDYNQKTILEELKIHCHPTSREMININEHGQVDQQRPYRARNTRESARELAEHYGYSHNIRIPT